MRIGLVGIMLILCGCAPQTLREAEARVRQEFPDVHQISPADLQKWLDDPTRPPPVLIDTRGADEYAVSHLHGAINLQDSTPPISRDEPIVVYCSVGYRSSRYARELQHAGFTDVSNLEGSIFAWANEGRPIERDGLPVNVVHPYDQRWAKLLAASHRGDP